MNTTQQARQSRWRRLAALPLVAAVAMATSAVQSITSSVRAETQA